MAREVLTLQFGHYSSFVGTHWWNLQESSFCYDLTDSSQQEINHDILFREGVNLRGERTYTPRLLVFDLKGSLRNLPQYGSLYAPPPYDSATVWPGKTSIYESEREPKNEFQMDLETELSEEFEYEPMDHKTTKEKYYELDKDAMVWSDFLGISLHPKSIQLVGDFLHNSTSSPFDVFGYGQGVAKDDEFFDNFESNLHFFVEECDSLQGFQILTDVFDGFGGLSSQVLENLKDEYGAKSFLTFGVAPALFANGTFAEFAHRMLNTTLSYHCLSEGSDVFVPVSLASELWPQSSAEREFPHLSYKPILPYHTSAILGVCVDTLTLPYRLAKPQALNMSTLLEVAFGERKIASASLALPVPVDEALPLATLLGSKLNRGATELLTPITPGVFGDSPPISQAAVIRGIPASLTHSSQRNVNNQKPSQRVKQRFENPFEICSSTNDIVRLFLQNLSPVSVPPMCWNVNQACMVSPPFPNIFSPRVTRDGLVAEGYARPSNSVVSQTSVLSRLETSPGIRTMLLSLIEWARKVNICKHHVFMEAGTDVESYKETLEELTNLAQRYEMP